MSKVPDSPWAASVEKPWKPWLPAAALIAVGLGLTAILVWGDLRRERAAEATRFAQLASERASELQQRFDRSLSYQFAARAFLKTAKGLRQEAFETFLEHATPADRPFQSLQYVPRISLAEREAHEKLLRERYGVTLGIWQRDPSGAPRRADQRAQYFPIHLVYPRDSSWIRGMDTSTEPSRRDAHRLALATGEPAATGPVHLVQRPEEWGFVVSVPVRDSEEPCRSESECRNSVIGFMVGVYVLSDLVTPLLEGLPREIPVYIFADGNPNAIPLFSSSAKPAPRRSALDAARVQWRSLRLAQHVWPVAFVQEPWTGWAASTSLILLLGLGLTSALALGQVRAQRHIARLQESTRHSQTLMANLPGAVYRVRNAPMWPAEFFSDGIQQLTGHSAAEHLAGKPLFGELILEEDRERVWEVVQAALQERSRFQVEYRVRTADGQIKWLWEQGIGVYDATGEARCLEGFVADITERRRDQVRATESEKHEPIRNLTAGLAHDFNNALAVVIGNLDIALAKTEEDGKLRRNLQMAQTAALRGLDLTKSLTAVARRLSLAPQDVHLNQAIRDLLPLIRKSLGPDSAILEKLSPEDPIVRADPGALNDAILNLVLHAREGMRADRHVVIETGVRTIIEAEGVAPSVAPGRYAVLSLRDSAGSMSADAAARAFEPYASPGGGPNGLDLATVYGFARQSGGTATVYSEPGKGTIVRIYLPSPLAEKSDTRSGQTSAMPRGEERVLVVDDEVALTEVAREWLESLGYKVAVAADTEEALARVKHEPWDLLLADIVRPGIDGIELARRARAQRPELRVLLCSGLSGQGDVTAASGFPILYKPYREDQLARAVRAALDA